MFSSIFGFLWDQQFKTCDVNIGIAIYIYNGYYTYAHFFRILSTIKIWSNAIVLYDKLSHTSLAQCSRLESSSWPFDDFIQMKIKQDLAIFNNSHLPFLIVPYSPFQKNETQKSWHNWLLSNWSRLLNWNGPGT